MEGELRYREQVSFLRNIFSESIPDVANIMVAQAEGDSDTIDRYLYWAQRKIETLREKLEAEQELYNDKR